MMLWDTWCSTGVIPNVSRDTPPAPLGAAEALPSISIPSTLTKLSLTRTESLSMALVGRSRNPVLALPVWRWLAPTWLPRWGV